MTSGGRFNILVRAASCGSILAFWIAGMRVAYIQIQMTNVQSTRARIGAMRPG
jgi:hypothetical protein